MSRVIDHAIGINKSALAALLDSPFLYFRGRGFLVGSLVVGGLLAALWIGACCRLAFGLGLLSGLDSGLLGLFPFLLHAQFLFLDLSPRALDALLVIQDAEEDIGSHLLVDTFGLTDSHALHCHIAVVVNVSDG